MIKKKEEKFIFKGENTVFYEIPLLFEKKWDALFDTGIVIAIDPEKQEKRLKHYRQMSAEEVRNRMKFQLSQSEKIKKANYVIWNNSSIKELEQQVHHLIDKINRQKIPK